MWVTLSCLPLRTTTNRIPVEPVLCGSWHRNPTLSFLWHRCSRHCGNIYCDLHLGGGHFGPGDEYRAISQKRNVMILPHRDDRQRFSWLSKPSFKLTNSVTESDVLVCFWRKKFPRVKPEEEEPRDWSTSRLTRHYFMSLNFLFECQRNNSLENACYKKELCKLAAARWSRGFKCIFI